ncbi:MULTISPECIES: transposase [Ensifer]|uniref:transposase n=1 Tax=Ensifer TaxID=106591 RepID=UPI001F28E857|nr:MULTISPECIES: transposase [Ensifer]MCY1745114.1 transposase [Ensifer sp. SL37]
MLLERGVAIAKSASIAQRTIPEIINNPRIDITELTREIIGTLHALLLQLNEKIRYFDKQIEAVFRESDVCQRIASIRGAGPKTATAVVAAVGDGGDFKNGRHLAAWMGLVPRQHSSGDRRVASASGATNICEHVWSTAGDLWCVLRNENLTLPANGSTSLGRGVVTTGQRLPSPTKTQG